VNLKQKTFLFVTVSIVALLVVYVGFSSYYVRTQEKLLLDERLSVAQAIAQELSGFFVRGLNRLQTVATLPGLVYYLQTLEENREGKQIPAWTTLHYLFYESDVFTSVHLINATGKVLWSEPPDQDLIETQFEKSQEIVRKLENPPADVAFVLSETPSGLDLLVASPLTDPEGRIVGLLAGTVPNSHPSIHAILGRIGKEHGTVQLVDEQTKRVIASTDEKRELHSFDYPDPARFLLVTEHAAPTPWVVVIDQNFEEAYAGINSLKTLLTGFGAIFILIAMGSLMFMLRSFTKPVEQLTAAARRIAEGDLTGGFTLDRSDEIGVLGKTLDDMKTKLKSSYDLLLHSEKMALMGQVVAGIAHELNNPLTIVIGNIQLMMMRELNEKNVQSLTRIKDGAERASKIVKNLLTFARQEKPERKPTDVNVILKRALELRAYELKVSNIEVGTQLAPDLPETMADPHQLQQVFLNLIVNAEQAMIDAHGKGLLRLSTRLEPGKILVFFSDDGPGIPQENLRRIFEPFFTTKPVGKGTGLGLSICQGIIGEHGGRVDVVSTIGRGTTFIIELPVQRWAPQPVPEPGFTRVTTGSRKRILVIEDEPQIRQLFEDVIRTAGYDVQTAPNGRVALDLIDQQEFDLIITDVKMPEISGAEFYAALKRKGAALEQRLIFVTGDLMNADTMQFIESTGRAWLGKPFDIGAIARTISDCLNGVVRAEAGFFEANTKTQRH
jgi:signal transduction histidine kinase/ActR/RegA family two-component response regulator